MGIIVDSFAGGGGASLGIAWALGRAPDLAINHDADAIKMHEANHPDTRHVLEDVWRADLRSLVAGEDVDLLWLSPDCRHFSRAKGGKPVSKRVRSLAWIACKWAAGVAPRVICLENVREFADWGPLVPRHECQACGWRGTEGQATLIRVRRRCPRCESLRLRKSDELVPDPARRGLTFRRFVGRLRNLGYHVEWRNLDAADYGAPTHRRRLFLVARRDGEPIRWPEPTHAAPERIVRGGLFPDERRPYRTAAECIDWKIPCPSIFDRPRALAEKTLRRIAHGVRRYVLEAAQPFIVPITHVGDRRIPSVDEALPTITTASRGEFALVAPLLAQTGYGERTGQDPRALDAGKPLGTVVAGGAKHALVAAFLATYYGNGPRNPDEARVRGLDEPIRVVTTENRHSIVAANLVHLNHGEKQWSGTDEPLRTLTTGNHAALVYSFLVRYFGTAIGQHLTDPLLTITGKDRFGLVTVAIDGQPYVIVDIGMRMLTPRELARAQGFPDTYVLTGTKTNQVARIGNSVCPQMAAAIVRANVGAMVEAIA